MDYLIEIERAKAVTEQAMHDAKSLADRLPDGLAKVAVLTLVSQLVQATTILSIRRPAVPCRLDFVAAAASDKDDTESIQQLARRLADRIESTKGTSCALVVVAGADDEYAHVAPDLMAEDAVRVMPGYKIELLNPPN